MLKCQNYQKAMPKTKVVLHRHVNTNGYNQLWFASLKINRKMRSRRDTSLNPNSTFEEEKCSEYEYRYHIKTKKQTARASSARGGRDDHGHAAATVATPRAAVFFLFWFCCFSLMYSWGATTQRQSLQVRHSRACPFNLESRMSEGRPVPLSSCDRAAPLLHACVNIWKKKVENTEEQCIENTEEQCFNNNNFVQCFECFNNHLRNRVGWCETKFISNFKTSIAKTLIL